MPPPKKTPATNRFDSLNDQECFILYKEQGNKKALGEIFRRHADMAYRLACNYAGNPNDAEDILQKIFLQILKQDLSKVTVPDHVRGWLMKAVINSCLLNTREKTRRLARHKVYVEEKPSEVEENVVQEKELHQKILNSIKILPIKYRMPLWMTLIEKLSAKECSEALALKEITLRKQVEKGLSLLRKTLTASGVGLSSLALATHISELPVDAAPETLKNYFTSATTHSAPLNKTGQNSAGTLVGSSFSPIKWIGLILLATSLTAGLLYYNQSSWFEKSMTPNEMIEDVNGYQHTFDFQNGIPEGIDIISGNWDYDASKKYWASESVLSFKFTNRIPRDHPLEIIVQTQKLGSLGDGKPRFFPYWHSDKRKIVAQGKVDKLTIKRNRECEYKVYLIESYIIVYINNKLLFVNKHDLRDDIPQLFFILENLPIKSMTVRELKNEGVDRKWQNPERILQRMKGRLEIHK